MLRVKDTRGTKNMMKSLQTTVLALMLVLVTGMTWAAQTVTYYHLDAQGSTIAATNEQGNLMWREAYEPYGVRLRKESTSSNTTWYTGKQEDAGAGLSYFGARWYDPEIGRFMGIDPVGFMESNPQSFNRFAYANNNPYKYVDPDGNLPIIAIAFFAFDTYQGYQESGNLGEAMTGAALGMLNPLKKLKTVSKVVAKGVGPKAGSAGGEGAKKAFSNKVKDQARKESNDTCVFCGTKTTREPGPTRSEIDHSIPKSRDGNNTIENAQNTCRTCNRSKGAKTTDEFLNR